MNTISNISELLKSMKVGFTVRDLLVNVQNYYLEAAKNGVMVRPDVDSLENIEEIYVGLGQSFGNFGIRVKMMEILPDEDVEFDDILPDVDSYECVASHVITRDADGVERMILNMK